MPISPKRITVCLGFDSEAEDAVRFYASVFDDLEILAINRREAGDPGGAKGSVRIVAFRLFGQDYLAFNGGPHFDFNDSISLMVNCETQAEIDRYWEKLTAGGGEPVECGWLKDRFGLRWQVVPRVLGEWMAGPDSAAAERVMAALLRMRKLDLETLKRAHAGAAQ